ncbi:MAG: hypothetical protein H2045_05345 [Rhizobiales bacterium]|nr:hypothetical protein [Hyphomicrobiales bacterium]
MRNLQIVFAFVILIIGLIFLPLPIPLGVPLISLALILMIQRSKFAKRSVRLLRQRIPAIDRMLSWLEEHAPRYAAAILRKTKPRLLKKRGVKNTSLSAQRPTQIV